MRGLVADDLHGAFAEIEAVASGTRCKQPFYSLAINPPLPLSREQYMATIDHIEGKLGLTNQPRAVVFHVKDGREHCHVVWSRIDLDNMRSIGMSHDHMKLRTCARELAHAYGLPLPDGLAEDRGDARFEKTRDVTFAERAMAEASGIAPAERRKAITTLFRSSDSAAMLRNELERAGYVLAQGERRACIVVDRAGHVHALARQIEGAKTRDVKARLADLPPESLPTVAEAQAQQAARQKAVDERLREKARQRGAKSAADMKAKQESRRRRAIDAKRQQLAITHASERMAMHAAHKAEQGRLFNIIAGKVFDLFDRVPGLRSVVAPLRCNPAINAAERHRLESDALNRRHDRERHAVDVTDGSKATSHQFDSSTGKSEADAAFREATNKSGARSAPVRGAARTISGAAPEVGRRVQTPRTASRTAPGRIRCRGQKKWHRPAPGHDPYRPRSAPRVA